MNISDFTDFEWDYVVIYNYQTTTKDIYQITGITYNKGLDLCAGMIFIHDNKIVYDEFFKTDFETPSKFKIYPYEDINAKSKIRKIEKEDAKFAGTKIKYENKNRYKFTPILSGSDESN